MEHISIPRPLTPALPVKRLRQLATVGLLALSSLLVLMAPPVRAQTFKAPTPVTQEVAAERFFDWAQAALPHLFPGKPATVRTASYVFRYYEATDTYLGVSHLGRSAGELRALVGAHRNPATAKDHRLGNFAKWACEVDPAIAIRVQTALYPLSNTPVPGETFHAYNIKSCLGLLMIGTPEDLPTDSPAQKRLEALNAMITPCGFPPKYPVRELGQSANAHAVYLDSGLNVWVGAHTESVGGVGFTGVTPADRAATAGYARRAGEVITADFASTNYTAGVLSLLSIVYHAESLLYPSREIGFNRSSSVDRGTIVANFGSSQNTDYLRGQVLTYPCDGLKNVDNSAGGETPNPTPDRDPARMGDLGTNLLFLTHAADRLEVQTIELTEALSGRAIKLIRPIVEGGINFTSRWGFLGDETLKENTSYRVRASGTLSSLQDDGVTRVNTTWSKDYTFTTGTRSLVPVTFD